MDNPNEQDGEVLDVCCSPRLGSRAMSALTVGFKV